MQLEIKALNLAEQITGTMAALNKLMEEHHAVMEKLQEKRKMSRRIRAYLTKVQVGGSAGEDKCSPGPAARKRARPLCRCEKESTSIVLLP